MTTLRNSILCGESKAILADFDAGSVDLVITDPPYLVNYKDRHGRTLKNDDNADGVLPVFNEFYRVLKDNSYCISFYGWNAIAKFSAAWKDCGFKTIGQIVFTKEYASKAGHTRYCHESAFILAKGYPRKPAKPMDDIQPWIYTGNKSHPTEKAVDIIRPLIYNFSRQGDLVLDPFAGAGSTAVAAALNNRDYIGIELEQKYCTIAERRLAGVQRYQEQKAALAA